MYYVSNYWHGPHSSSTQKFYFKQAKMNYKVNWQIKLFKLTYNSDLRKEEELSPVLWSDIGKPKAQPIVQDNELAFNQQGCGPRYLAMVLTKRWSSAKINIVLVRGNTKAINMPSGKAHKSYKTREKQTKILKISTNLLVKPQIFPSYSNVRCT